MKKFLSLILSLVMALGVSTVTFADTNATTYTDTSSVDLVKSYKLQNAGTSNPEETFAFTITREAKSDSQYATLNDVPLPTFKDGKNTIKFNTSDATVNGLEKTTTINLPTYDHVGIYTYKIAETKGTTDGVTYDANPLYLKVTVIQQGNQKVRVATLHYADINAAKTDKGFTNIYSAGNLSIKKEVTGNMGEVDRYFDVKVTLTAPEGTLASTVKVTGGSKQYNEDVTFVNKKAEITVQLKNDDTVTLTNLPYGVTYTVTENDYTGDGYKEAGYTYTDNDKKVDSAQDTVTITNNKEKEVTTGIFMDNLPYIMILTVVVVGIGALVIKRRIASNNN